MNISAPFLSMTLSLLFMATVTHGQRTEVKVYSQLYTQDASFNGEGDKIPDTSRFSFITNIIEFNLKNDDKRSWWGFEAWIRGSKRHQPGDAPFEVLSYENNATDARSGLSHVGAKWHWRPFKKQKDLYLKTLLLVPTNNTPPPTNGNLPFLDDTGYQYFLQLNYAHKIAKDFWGYYEFGGWWRIDRQVEPADDFLLPTKAYLTYFPVSSVGVYGFGVALPTLSDPQNHVFQFGGGVKIFPHKNWAFEVSVGAFAIGQDIGAGYNIDASITYTWERGKDKEK